MKIKADCVLWLDDSQSVADKFVSDYSLRFKSTNRINNAFLDLGLHRSVSELENEELIKFSTLEEVRTTLLGLDSNKTPGPDGFGAGFFKHY